MLFDSALVSSFLFASAVLAGRSLESYQPRFLNSVDQSTDAASDNIIFDNNWSGAFWEKGNGTFSYVTGTFTVPVLEGKSGSAAAVWVGIDGAKCQSLFHTGVNLVVTDHGSSYNAWYEWFPEYPKNFTDFPISAGDNIRLTVIVGSMTTGIAIVENLRNNVNKIERIQSDHALCGQSAEWLVEDYRQGGDGQQVPFANFGTVTITDAVATGSNTSKKYTPQGAIIADIRLSNKTLTSVSTSGSSVTIKRV